MSIIHFLPDSYWGDLYKILSTFCQEMRYFRSIYLKWIASLKFIYYYVLLLANLFYVQNISLSVRPLAKLKILFVEDSSATKEINKHICKESFLLFIMSLFHTFFLLQKTSCITYFVRLWSFCSLSLCLTF